MQTVEKFWVNLAEELDALGGLASKTSSGLQTLRSGLYWKTGCPALMAALVYSYLAVGAYLRPVFVVTHSTCVSSS